MVSVAMNQMRDLESGIFRKALELLGKIPLPFRIGALVGSAVDYYEMPRLGKWASYRLEALAGAPRAFSNPTRISAGGLAADA